MKGTEMNQTKDNSTAKHPLVGIVHHQPQKNQMPKMADELGLGSLNRENTDKNHG